MLTKKDLDQLINIPFIDREQINQAVARIAQAIYRAINSSTPWKRICEHLKDFWNQECQKTVKEA
jgi:hypothetical protein